MKAFWKNFSQSKWPCWQSNVAENGFRSRAASQGAPAELRVSPPLPSGRDQVPGIAGDVPTPARAAAPAPSAQPRPAADEKDQAQEVEARALLQLSEIVANCLESNTMFVDPEFAPSLKALFVNGRCRRGEADQLLIVQHFERNHGREIHWRRPGEILQRPDDLMMEFKSREEMIMTMHQIATIVEWRVFQSDPKPTDISQGALGNCWFCGSLAAVAEKPRLVKALFVDECSKRGELSPVGLYLVRLCDGGEWRFVPLDDHFPCNKSCMLAYSGARRNQLWVPLVEKAFAKLRGCYEETEGGNPSEGLRLLTGWPSIVLHLQRSEAEEGRSARTRRPESGMSMQASCPFEDEEILWARLVSACSADLILCGSCGHVDGISREMYREAGLSPSHCYSLVQVVVARAGSLKLIKIRNPWGTGLKWKGDFSDGDSKNWTPELKAEVGAGDLGKDGGIFWMTLQDLRRYFNSITICPYREGWNERRITATFPQSFYGAQPGFWLGTPTGARSTDSLLSLMQPEERQTLTTMTADLGLALFRVPAAELSKAGGGLFGSSAGTRKNVEFVDSSRREVHDTLLRDHFIEARKDGAGLLAVPLSFNQRAPSALGVEAGATAKAKRFTFCCFSAREVPVRSLSLAPELVRDALVAHIKAHGSVGSQSHGIKLWKLAEAGLMVYVENPSLAFVEVSVELTELFNTTVSRGVEMDPTGQLMMKTRDMVPPMHGMVIFVAAAMPAGHTYCFSSRFIPRVDPPPGPAHTPPLAEPADALHNPAYLDGVQLSPVPTASGRRLR